MAKAKKSKPRDHVSRWTVHLIKATPMKFLGGVYASSEAEAVERAIKEFKIAEALQDRIVVRREDY